MIVVVGKYYFGDFMIKTKLYLTLIALNGLILSASSVSAATISSAESTNKITELSRDIARLIDVEDRANLVALAIDRALLAQATNAPQLPRLRTAGVPRLPTQDDKTRSETDNPKTQDNDQPKSIDSDRVIHSTWGMVRPKNQPSAADGKTSPPENRPIEPQIKMPSIGRIENKPSTTNLK
jgi:hypothetical protein